MACAQLSIRPPVFNLSKRQRLTSRYLRRLTTKSGLGLLLRGFRASGAFEGVLVLLDTKGRLKFHPMEVIIQHCMTTQEFEMPDIMGALDQTLNVMKVGRLPPGERGLGMGINNIEAVSLLLCID